MTRPRLAIFDVDGTLVDSQAHIKGAMARAFDGLGMEPPENVLGIVGLSLHEAMRRLAPALEESRIDLLVDGYKAAFFDLRVAGAPSPLYSGAIETLDALAKRDDILLGIATGKSRRGLDHVLAVHDLGRFFVTEQVADHHPSKPHPSMIFAALSETGVAAEDAVMIGDTSFDMEMGRSGGVRTVGVSWGYHDAEDLRAADRVVTSFHRLRETLDEMWGA